MQNANRTLTRVALAETLPSWGVLLLESHHSPEFSMDWRQHSFLKIVHVLDGLGEFQFRDTELQFSRGDVIVVPPRMPNRIEDMPGHASSLYVCCIDTTRLDFDASLLQALGRQRVQHGQHVAGLVAGLMRKLVHAQAGEAAFRPIAMVGCALRLVELLLRYGEPSSPNVKTELQTRERDAVASYIQSLPESFFEATSIDAAAASIDVPRRTFTRLFMELQGETWLQCIRRLAIEHARNRLEYSDLSVLSIAFECGFSDVSTFYRQFNRHVGVSPAKYRNAVRSLKP